VWGLDLENKLLIWREAVVKLIFTVISYPSSELHFPFLPRVESYFPLSASLYTKSTRRIEGGYTPAPSLRLPMFLIFPEIDPEHACMGWVL